RNSPIERGAGHSCDARNDGDILLKRVKVRRCRAIDVVVHSQVVCEPSKGMHQTECGVQTLGGIPSADAREGITQPVFRLVILKPEIEICGARTLVAPCCSPAASATKSEPTLPSLTESAPAERMIQPEVDVIRL